jgi:sialate O-acetylesterase
MNWFITVVGCLVTAEWTGLPDPYSQTPGQPWVYPNSAGVVVVDPSGSISFAGSITDYMVLQAGEDTAAAVYGTLTDTPPGTVNVTVTVSETGSAPYSVDAELVTLGSPGFMWKAYLKPHPAQGGDVTISARCATCTNSTEISVHHATYGDVWFCAGQSNMELPMAHALTRNRTYDLLDGPEGRYKNIRTFKRGDHVQAQDGQEVWALPPPPAPACRDSAQTPRCYYGWQVPNSTTVDEFSAACWFTAQELTDMALDRGEAAPVIGLIQSAWGGTEIESWLRNDTIAECRNATGGAVGTKGGARLNGAIYNGMVAPFVNTTIFGALWYQVSAPHFTALHRTSRAGGPHPPN